MSNERERRLAKIIAKSWRDEAYKKRLLDDPHAVLKEEGVEVPSGQQVKFVANSANKVHFVIPTKPDKDMSEEEISKRHMSPMETTI